MLTEQDIAEAKRALKELADEAQGNGNSDGWIAAQERPIRAVIAAHEAKAAPAVPQGNDPAWTLAAKVREALDRKACPGYYMDVAVEAVVHNYAPAAPSQPVRGVPDVATWLWLRFADYCRKQGMNPHHQNDLFAIVNELRAMLASTTPPVQAASQPVTLTDEDILRCAALTIGEQHVENCGLGDIKEFAHAIIAALREKEGK